jgi:hypothetical protein
MMIFRQGLIFCDSFPSIWRTEMAIKSTSEWEPIWAHLRGVHRISWTPSPSVWVPRTWSSNSSARTRTQALQRRSHVRGARAHWHSGSMGPLVVRGEVKKGDREKIAASSPFVWGREGDFESLRKKIRERGLKENMSEQAYFGLNPLCCLLWKGINCSQFGTAELILEKWKRLIIWNIRK